MHDTFPLIKQVLHGETVIDTIQSFINMPQLHDQFKRVLSSRTA